MKKPERMIRLIQGDVGSGKTIVAFLSLALYERADFLANRFTFLFTLKL